MAWIRVQFGKAFSDLDREVIETIVTPAKFITVMNMARRRGADAKNFSPRSRCENPQEESTAVRNRAA
jgi:hypothetical protein